MLKPFLVATFMLAGAAPTYAQSITFKPLAEARLRLETVDQDGIAREAHAVTARVRAGLEGKTGRWTALIEGQGTVALDERYYDGLHGSPTRSLVADPENLALYRAQLQYRTPTLGITAGRQRISLDDDRFVDSALFRQNAVTYDAVRVEWSGIPKLKADVTYAWSVRTVWGRDGRGARQQAISGDNIFANLSYTTPVGTLTGYAYLVDQDEFAVQAYRFSNQTYGGKLQGSRAVGRDLKASYQLSAARQSDYHRNPNDYSASFYQGEASLDVKQLRGALGFEIAGADKGLPFTSFQYPVGSGIRWRGWAAKFNPTPPDGLRDYYAGLNYGVKRLGPVQGLSLQGTYHRFTSDRLVRVYGNEFDLHASGKVNQRTTVTARWAHFKADGFATDTDKVWLQLDWVL